MINRQCLPLQFSVDRCGNWVDFHGTLCYDGGVGPKCHQSLVLRVRRHKTQIEAQWKKVKKNYVSLLLASFQKHYLLRGRIVLSTLHRPLWLDLSFVVNRGHAWFANGSWKKREKENFQKNSFMKLTFQLQEIGTTLDRNITTFVPLYYSSICKHDVRFVTTNSLQTREYLKRQQQSQLGARFA